MSNNRYKLAVDVYKTNKKGIELITLYNTMKALITRKIDMTSTIDEDGMVQAVTLLSASPCVITQVKTDETDGYQSLQIGFEETKRVNKPQENHFKNSGKMPKVVREFRKEKNE